MSYSERRTGSAATLGDRIEVGEELGEGAEALGAEDGEVAGAEAGAAAEEGELEEEEEVEVEAEKQVILISLAGYAACSVLRSSSTWAASCTQAAWRRAGEGQGGQRPWLRRRRRQLKNGKPCLARGSHAYTSA